MLQEDEEDEEIVTGRLGREGKAKLCSLLTWPLRTSVVDVLDRGDTTGGGDGVVAQSVPAARLANDLYDLVFPPTRVVLVNRLFFLDGAYDSQKSSFSLACWLEEVKLSGPLVGSFASAISAKIPERKAEP